MKMTPEKGQFLIAALDNYVKERGLAVAGTAVMMLAEIQADLAEATRPVEDNKSAEDEPVLANEKE